MNNFFAYHYFAEADVLEKRKGNHLWTFYVGVDRLARGKAGAIECGMRDGEGILAALAKVRNPSTGSG